MPDECANAYVYVCMFVCGYMCLCQMCVYVFRCVQQGWKHLYKPLCPLVRPLVGRSVRPSVLPSPSNFFSYNSWTIGRIETKMDVRVDIDDGKNFLEGQGHKVKGQGQIGDFVENLFGL